MRVEVVCEVQCYLLHLFTVDTETVLNPALVIAANVSGHCKKNHLGYEYLFTLKLIHMKKKFWNLNLIIWGLLIVFTFSCEKKETSNKKDPIITWANPADINLGQHVV